MEPRPTCHDGAYVRREHEVSNQEYTLARLSSFAILVVLAPTATTWSKRPARAASFANELTVSMCAAAGGSLQPRSPAQRFPTCSASAPNLAFLLRFHRHGALGTSDSFTANSHPMQSRPESEARRLNRLSPKYSRCPPALFITWSAIQIKAAKNISSIICRLANCLSTPENTGILPTLLTLLPGPPCLEPRVLSSRPERRNGSYGRQPLPLTEPGYECIRIDSTQPFGENMEKVRRPYLHPTHGHGG